MGGELRGPAQGRTPRFRVHALKDARGANLDRIQIVKGWLDKDGKTHERIYDVAVSDGREIGANGRCTTPVGTTVDVGLGRTSAASMPEIIAARDHILEKHPNLTVIGAHYGSLSHDVDEIAGDTAADAVHQIGALAPDRAPEHATSEQSKNGTRGVLVEDDGKLLCG